MVIKDKLTGAERNAFDQACRLLGDNLSALLLSGLGETQIIHRRTFTARSMAEQGDETAYQLEMTNDSEHGLPIGTDPLVIAHLLNLLREEMRMADNIDINADDILKTLGWSRTPDSHLFIKQAVERYASANFCLINQAASDADSRSCFQRLLIGYETVSKSNSAKAASQQLLMKVRFFPSFIYGVFGQRKSFLGIDFSQLQGMREISG